MDLKDRFVKPLREFLSRLTPQQRIGLLGAAAAVVVALLAVIVLASRTVWVTVFPGEGAAAAAVLDRLREAGYAPRTAEAGVQVPSEFAAEARLRVAAMTGFDPATSGCDEEPASMTAPPVVLNERLLLCREDALSRLVSAMEPLEWGRVKLAMPRESPFLEDMRPAKASVIVNPKPGRTLTPAMVRAIQVQVAGAVEGLAPEMVAITDTRMRLYTRFPAAEEVGATSAMLEQKAALEEALRQKVREIVERRFGAGKGVVHVTVELDPSSEEVRESEVDPEKVAALSERSVEASDTKGGAAEEGVPGATANLPGGQGAAEAETTAASVRSEEVRANEVSRRMRLVERPAGALRRIAVAVMVEGTWEGEGEQRTYKPPAEADLKKIENLVKAAVGFDARRGDVVSVEEAPFESPEAVAAPAPSPLADVPWHEVVRYAGIALILVAIWALLVRPITRAFSAAGAGAPSGVAGAGAAAAEAGEAESGDPIPTFQERLRLLTEGGMEGNREELARLLREDLDHTVAVLRSWIADDTVPRS